MIRSLSLVMAILTLVCSLPAAAVRYEAGLNQAEWRLDASPFECRLWQPIPYFGDAVFSHLAGEEQRFFLQPTRKAMKTGKATLISQAPRWDQSRQPVSMGMVDVRDSDKPIYLGKQRAYQLLSELYDGMSPVFSHGAWYSDNEQVELALSSVNFRKAYRQYRDCLASLLPVNFEQINRSRVHFKTAKFELTPDSRKTLDYVVQYAKADTSISGFFIDGHTDSVGTRLDNLELSKKRAEAVTKYLVTRGIDEARITTRYHGERYPVVNNSTAANRAANRRVTIRLDRDTL